MGFGFRQSQPYSLLPPGGIVRPNPSSSGVRDRAANVFASASSASRQSGKKSSCFTGGRSRFTSDLCEPVPGSLRFCGIDSTGHPNI